MYLEDKKAGESPTLAEFIAWLETKNPAETYDWIDIENCAVAQFCREKTGRWDSYNSNSPIARLDKLAYEACDNCGAATLGRLLQKAKAKQWNVPADCY